MKAGAILVVAVGVILAAATLFSAWLTMLLGNVVLTHYGIRTLDYTSALALTIIMAGFPAAISGAFRAK